MTWTPERLSILETMRAAGHSFGAIAKVIGVTRNAAIGRGRRLGLLAVAQPRIPSVARPPMLVPASPEPLPEPEVTMPEPKTKSIPLREADHNQCRWIVQESPPMVCGEPGRVWCPKHRAVVYSQAPKRKDYAAA